MLLAVKCRMNTRLSYAYASLECALEYFIGQCLFLNSKNTYIPGTYDK
jgi:hypothetical protein